MAFTEKSLAKRIAANGYIKVKTSTKGEPDMVEIVSGGIFDGNRIPVICSTPEIALELLWYAYVQYRRTLIGKRPGTTLVWRIKPDVTRCVKRDENDPDGLEYYSAYMRIAIR